jgi:homoserine kinase
MHKVNVSIPAVSTNVGPGYDVLGLALNLRNTIEMSLRSDDQLTVETRGEGADQLPTDFYNPVMQGAIKLFQRLEQAPAGLAVRCTNVIPLDVGLSSRATLVVGGLVGANNLLGSPFSHEDLIEMAAELTGQPESVVTTMRGGLGLCSRGTDGTLIYRAIEIAALRVVIALPDVPAYTHLRREDLPARVLLADAVQNVGHTALLIEALRDGDLDLLRHTLADRLHEPHRRDSIPAFHEVERAALDTGAIGVTLCGAGPALMVFASYNHQHIADAMQAAFEAADVTARTWTVGGDLQGVVISVVQ